MSNIELSSTRKELIQSQINNDVEYVVLFVCLHQQCHFKYTFYQNVQLEEI